MKQETEFRQAFKNINRVFSGELNNYTKQHRADILIITASNNESLPKNMQATYQETEQLFDKAETIYKNTLDLQNPGDLNSLGELYLLRHAHNNSGDYLTKAKDTLSQAITIIKDKNDIFSRSKAPKDIKKRNQYIESNYLLYKAYDMESESIDPRYRLENFDKQRKYLTECIIIDKYNPQYFYLYAELVFKNRNIIPKRETPGRNVDPYTENLQVALFYNTQALQFSINSNYAPSINDKAKLLDKEIRSKMSSYIKSLTC